jgi:hypothetical protein
VTADLDELHAARTASAGPAEPGPTPAHANQSPCHDYPGAAMTHPDHDPHAAGSMPAGHGSASERESVYHAYLTTDIRPAILAASPDQLRDALRHTATSLCRYLHDDIAGIAPLRPDTRQPWELCQTGHGIHAGFQLYRHVLQAVAGSYLHALGFDPARAATDGTYLSTRIAPSLAAARTRRLRRTLLELTRHLRATVDDSDTAAATSAQAGPEIPDDLWEIAAGVNAGIQLYHQATRMLAVHTAYQIWHALAISGTPAPAWLPFTPGTADPGLLFVVHPN